LLGGEHRRDVLAAAGIARHRVHAAPLGRGRGRRHAAAHAAAGVDVDALATKLQSDAATSFVESWNDLMAIIDRQSAALTA